jgi:hypothetical protein
MSQIQDRIPARKAEFRSHEQALRAALEWVRARHDSGALSPAVFAVIRMLETELAWLAHRSFAADSAILISLLLQYDATPAEIGHALRRAPNGSAASLIGAVVDRLAEMGPQS